MKKYLTTLLALPLLIIASLTMYACSEDPAPTTYEVTIEDNLDFGISAQGIPFRSSKLSATDLEAKLAASTPSTENLVFKGYYSDEALTQEFSPLSINADATIYIKWGIFGVTLEAGPDANSYYAVSNPNEEATALYFPDEVNGKDLYIKQSGFANNQHLTSVEFETNDGDRLGNLAFNSCTNLKNVFVQSTDFNLNAYGAFLNIPEVSIALQDHYSSTLSRVINGDIFGDVFERSGRTLTIYLNIPYSTIAQFDNVLLNEQDVTFYSVWTDANDNGWPDAMEA